MPDKSTSITTELTRVEKEKTITLRISRFLHYALGDLDKSAIGPEEALLLDALQISAIHIQWNDLDTGKRLAKPIIWQTKKWIADEQYRAEQRRQATLRKNALDKLHESINSTIKLLKSKTGLSEELLRPTAEKMVLTGDHTFLKSVGITLSERTQEEINALNYQSYQKIK